ncbi:hypothetical protein DL762_003230 [Monosporascus cannonballus]|uniref:Uncharacterized protein n=1 Tax=Monosporascus cannonballus TaxID=155416 RepID=A0ABY0HB73_9PEZI|nr:hypothetical protein DL762_003230 [Monosporascus cannonballus]
MKHKRRWTSHEDRILREGYAAQAAYPTGKGQTVNWKEIANKLPGRSNKDCRKRYLNEMAGTLKKGPWSKEEDALLIKLVEKHSPSWVAISQAMGTRNADQCAKRWQHSLNPELDRHPWQESENQLLLRALATHGTSWKDIQKRHFPARSTNNIKNQYTVLMRRDTKMTPDPDSAPCCPDKCLPETPYSLNDDLPTPISMDLCETMYDAEQFNEDGFLKSLSVGTPGTDMNEFFESVFDDSAPSLELLTPIENDNTEHSLFSSICDGDKDQTAAQPTSQQIESQGLSDQDIFLTEPFFGLPDGLNNDNFRDFTNTIQPPFKLPQNQLPGLEMGKGCNSQSSSPSLWGDCELQVSRAEEASRMTIVIDEARPETLTEIMKVLMESRARVEFRRG